MVPRQVTRQNDQGNNLKKTDKVYPSTSPYPLYQCSYKYDVTTEHNPTENA
jgi:hypothetical protein